MSYESIEIKNLPLANEVKDEDLVVIEKENFTAAAPAGLLKGYLIEELANTVAANTYTADEVTLTLLSGTEFKVKDGSITQDQLSPDVVAKLGTGGSGSASLTGVVSTYTNPITSQGEYLEVFLQPAPNAALERYAIRVYKVQ
jgi:hypothetical protein